MKVKVELIQYWKNVLKALLAVIRTFCLAQRIRRFRLGTLPGLKRLL